MRLCHVCQAENEDDAPKCFKCGARLRRRDRSTTELSVSPYSSAADPINRPAIRAYFMALWGLIPFLGLILGPLAAVLGMRGLILGRGRPGFSAEGPGVAAVVLGSAETLTQWAGVTLLWWGLSW
jgi:hypothetical protein